MAPAKLALTSNLTLPNSIQIPQLGFGVYLSPKKQCTRSCLAAFKAGYRHIDTAQYYENEAEVGAALHQSSIPRSELFVTTKIANAHGSIEKSYQSCLNSVHAAGGGEDGYVDLFLIHNANVGAAGRKELWLALERLYAEGRAKSIGVSNFGIGHIQEMKGYATVWPPHVNQLEMHPWCQQKEIDEYCRKVGIVVEAYSPLVRNQKAEVHSLKVIAEKHAVTTAQALIRYSLQKGWVPLPKSDTPSRIAGNADVYSFELTEEDMGSLDALDEGSRGSICFAVSNTL